MAEQGGGQGAAAVQMGEFRKLLDEPEVYVVGVPGRSADRGGTNSYIVKSGDEFLVVDNGYPMPDGAAALHRAWSELGITAENTQFFVTHLHADHFGLTRLVVEPGALLLASAEEVRIWNEGFPFDMQSDFFKAMVAEGLPLYEQWEYACYGLHTMRFDDPSYRYRLLSEGDVVRVGSIEFVAVDTAGHSPGHMALFDPASGIFFSGDQLLFGVTPCISAPFGDRDIFVRYRQNMRKIAGMPVKHLLPGHEQPLPQGYVERANWLYDHLLERVQGTLEDVRKGPEKLGMDYIAGIPWNVPNSDWRKLPMPLRWCIVTNGMAMLEHLVLTEQIERFTDDEGMRRYRPL